MSARVTSRPMEMPKWVAEERRGRSGQGQEVMSERSLGRDRSSPEEMTQDLSLLIPRPERVEKVEMMERAGEMSETWRADIAKSSAKAKHLMLGRVERAVRRGS